MLKHLSIRDFVIIDQVELDCMSGFTVLTGESGAGKSILINALSLVLGERGDADQIRSGCERAEINAIFDIGKIPELIHWLRDNDLQGDTDVCLIRRIVEINGRSRSYINGHAATLQQLRLAGEFLVTIHSQHAHQALLQKDTQRELLDAFSGSSALAGIVRAAYLHWQDCRQQRIDLEQRLIESSEQREYLEWQLQELSNLGFTLAEWQTLQADHARLSHMASLLEAVENGMNLLSEQENAALACIGAVNSQLDGLLAYDHKLKVIVDLLSSAQIQLQEGIYELKHYWEHLDMDPQALQEIEQRLSDIHNMARKFRMRPEELPQLLESVTQQLEVFGANSDITQLQLHENSAQVEYHKQAETLSVARQQAAEALSRQVSDTMQAIALTGGEFAVALIPLAQGSINGLEQIEFQVTAHPGIPLRPLAKVASGGELSRISLAIQVVTSKTVTVPTLVFDEVDTGIGGQVAEIIGHLLKKLGRERQVLCITHLPQVAATGDQQWQVVKSSESTDVQPIISRINILNPQERVEEVARMLGGINITETTRRHAIEILQNNTDSQMSHARSETTQMISITKNH